MKRTKAEATEVLKRTREFLNMNKPANKHVLCTRLDDQMETDHSLEVGCALPFAHPALLNLHVFVFVCRGWRWICSVFGLACVGASRLALDLFGVQICVCWRAWRFSICAISQQLRMCYVVPSVCDRLIKHTCSEAYSLNTLF